MSIDSHVQRARDAGASDLHLEPGSPVGLRVRGELKLIGEPLPAETVVAMAKDLLGSALWEEFAERRSFDLTRVIRGVRCRVNVLETSAGVGLAIRLLSSFQATLRTLNLHPDLKKLIGERHGLIVLSGPTGSGKSTTLSALIQEINLAECRHIVTIESPIEYALAPRRSIIRQREVGRHTPSFEQALLDALREDPDVLMVGEMREPETMRLVLNAAQTGHLVLTSMHSATTAEALQRLVSAFPPEVQSGICSQLADCLVAVVAQQLRFRPEQRMLVPECEILTSSSGVKGIIRQGAFFRLPSALETGRQDGCWTLSAYREWLDTRRDWVTERERAEHAEAPPYAPLLGPPAFAGGGVGTGVGPGVGSAAGAQASLQAQARAAPRRPPSARQPPPPSPEERVIVIEESDDDPAEILSKLGQKR
jgi:twitching motility protein PilT